MSDRPEVRVCPGSRYTRDDVRRFDHSAYVANRRGDRCGWVLLSSLATHLRDALWDPLPWLRDDVYGANIRAQCPRGWRFELRSGRRCGGDS